MSANHWLCGLTASLLTAYASASQEYYFDFEINSSGLPNDGVIFSGHANGDASGNLIGNLSNIYLTITAQLNGSPFNNGAGGYFANYSCCDAMPAAARLATLSLDGFQNDFLFTTNYLGQPLQVRWQPFSTSDPKYASYNGYIDGYYGTPYLASTSLFGGLFPGWNVFAYSAWSLTTTPPTVPSVPEPGTWAMLLLGMGVAHLLALGKKSQQHQTVSLSIG